MASSMKALEASLAALDAPRAPKASGYHTGLQAYYRPSDAISAMAGNLEAAGVPIVRTEYGFRTMNAAEREAADIDALLASRAMLIAAE